MKNLNDRTDIYKEIPQLKEQFESVGNCLGNLVYANRVKQGLTQEELAAVSNVEPVIVYKAEGGSNDMNVKLYDKLFKGLGVNLSDLMK